MTATVDTTGALASASISRENTLAEIPLSELNNPENDGQENKLLPEELDDPALEDEYPIGFRLVAILIGCIAAMFLANLDMTIVATAIPRITDEFHSLSDVGWYGSAFFLTVASFQSTWGKVLKYFPLKAGVIGAIAVFELGSLVCAVAPNSATLIVGRAIAGLGAGGIVAGDYTIIAFSAPPRRRTLYTSFLGITYGIASVVGPLVGGVFTDNLTWRWCFWINLPIGSFAALIIFLFFHTPSAAKTVEASAWEKLLQLDFPGTFTLMGAVVCYLLALQWGGATVPWSDPKTYGLLVGFGLLMFAFALIEWKMGERAAVIPRLLRQRTVLFCSIYDAFLQGGFFLLVYYIPIYFQSIDNTSAALSGMRNLPLILSLAIFQLLTGTLTRIWAQYVPLLIVGAAVATVGAGLLWSQDIGTGAGEWIGYQILVGVGVGISIQIPVVAAQSRVPVSDLAPVTAMVIFFSTLGSAMFISAGQAVFSNTLISSLAQTAPSADPLLVIGTGATSLQQVFAPDVLPGILRAYMDGLKAAFVVAIAVLGLATVSGVFVEWKTFESARDDEKDGDA
ncbi:gliotoxin efflux pump [Dacryopinax primogenitus]|uniref:Gliotoxin efflux pump n=1 Tax=Dacryopinax primogenitus (strain DJM 731) TaxID=1858805 RepID=M5FTG1_DACPD|nr:gliotoxin efflux pump [Dacryopinax primogenitus]EJU00926.1 gliotoxin efflux pump [Dacryopinax primogenitus]